MRVMSNSDYRLFRSLASLKQESLRKNLISIMKRKYDKIHITKDFIYAIGDIPVTLVAHMDTVFPSPPGNIYYDKEAGVMWSPDGLGADDRAGVFAILKIIQAGYKPSVIFTTDEEKGALGADMLSILFPEPVTETKYVIQLDRRGTSDCVFYECENDEFTEYVESFGFIEAFGSFSDISVICPAWKIAGVNLSVGYEDEHSVSETLHVAPLYATIERVKKMLDAAAEAPAFEYIPGTYQSWWKMYASGTDEVCGGNVIRCDKCRELIYDFEGIPVTDENGKTITYCPDCATIDGVSWCNKCGKPFISSLKQCPKCNEMEDKVNRCSTTTKISSKDLML